MNENNQQKINTFSKGKNNLATFREKMIWNQISDLVPDIIGTNTSEQNQKNLVDLVERSNKIKISFWEAIDAIYKVDAECNLLWH